MTIFDPEGRPIEMIDDSEVHGSDPYVVLDPLQMVNTLKD